MGNNLRIFNHSEIRGTYSISSNTCVKLTQGTVLKATENLDKYLADDSIFLDNCGNELGRSMFFANGCENIEILGEEGSVIDGEGWRWVSAPAKTKRPSLIRLVDCRNVKILNLTLKDSPCWCIHLHNCENVLIENVKIKSWCNVNNDGIDIDCCRNVRVKNCEIDTGDDAIVLKATKNILSENIHISDCVITSRWAGFKIGTETVGDFRNIIFENSKIVRSEGGTVKIMSVDGSVIDGVNIRNIIVEKGSGPIFIANGYRMREYFAHNKKSEPGRIKKVTFENFNANVYINEADTINAGKGVVLITGSQDRMIENIELKDCNFNMPCGCLENKDYSVGELTTGYPEFYALGTTPSYGAYLRHAKNVTFKNVKFNKCNEDVREEIVVCDVQEFKVEND